MLDFLIWACQLMHTGLCLPLPHFTQTPLCSALCFMDYCQNFVWDGSSKGQLTLLNFTKEASTRQRLIAFLFLVDVFHVDLFTSSTWAQAELTSELLLKDRTSLCRVEECKVHVTFYQCPSCVYFVSVKEWWVQWSEEAGRGRRKLHRPFWENAENTKKTESASHSSLKIYKLYCSVNCV